MCPPSFEKIALADGVAAWRAAVDGFADWCAGALERGATPPGLAVDWVRWWSVTERRPPRWNSANEGGIRGVGHDSCIVDYSPAQSQMRTI